MARSLLLLTAIALFFAACKKADETVSPEDKLRGGQWKRTSLKSAHKDPTTGVVTITDAFATLPTCVKDNGLEFKTNYKGSEFRNDKCNPGDAAENAFTWEIANSGKTIRIYNATETFGGLDVNAEVINQSETQISMRYLVITQDPTQTTPTDTFTITDVFRK